MAFPQVYCIEWLDGHEVTERRGLAWLIPRPNIEGVNGKSIFDDFDDVTEQNFRDRFDWWLRTIGITHKKFCHGWDEDGYKDVWVFKYQDHRIFGFLCHPDDQNKRFQMCVLSSHTMKEGWEADKTLKDLMSDFAKHATILEAARNVHEHDECPYQNGDRKK